MNKLIIFIGLISSTTLVFGECSERGGYYSSKRPGGGYYVQQMRPIPQPQPQQESGGYYAKQVPAEERNIYGRGGSDNARFVITGIPASSDVYVDGVKRPDNSNSVRSFVSANLPDNDTYVYNFEIRFQQAGQAITKIKKVPFQKGQTINLVFSEFEDPAASKDEQLSAPAKAK